tara:strand:- start:466 stop:1029 length:564 start_codon:yes stop_codon:yes gene_type:complete
MLVQLFIMLIPVYLGTSFYVNNKEEIQYSKNLHVKKLVDRANDIGDLPITTVTEDVLNSTHTAKESVAKAIEILSRMNVISKQVKKDIGVMKNIRELTTKIVKPIDEVTDLLNDKTRAQVHKVIKKVNDMLEKLTDDEISNVLNKITAVSNSAERFLSPENQNMTNHVLKDSDLALANINKILGKFN